MESILIGQSKTGAVESILEQNKKLPQMFWRGTIEEYDAIETKSEDTLYLITNDNVVGSGVTSVDGEVGDVRLDTVYDAYGSAVAVKEELAATLQEVRGIALGRSAGFVFQTKRALDTWLEDETHIAQLKQGDNLYIIDKEVPDYWWDGTQIQELETQKVDLAEYEKTASVDEKLGEKADLINGKIPEGQLDIITNEKIDSIIEDVIVEGSGILDEKALQYYTDKLKGKISLNIRETPSMNDWAKKDVLASNTSWLAAAYEDGKFVALGFEWNNGSYIMHAAYSYDGITWKDGTIQNVSCQLHGMTYGNGMFVSTGVSLSGEKPLCYSANGINWYFTTCPILSTSYLSAIGYGDGIFVLINKESAGYSIDLTNWTNITLPYNGSWNCITYGNGKFVALTSGSGIGAYSDDGIHWTQVSTPRGLWNSVVYNGKRFVAVGHSNVNGDYYSMYSDNGIDWQSSDLTAHNWTSVTYGNGLFLASGDSSAIAWSVNGETWTEKSGTWANSATALYGDNKFWVVGGQSGKYVFYTLPKKFIYLGDKDITDSLIEIINGAAIGGSY